MAIFEKTTEEQKTESKSAPRAAAGNLRAILVKPRISEKAAKSADHGKYVFEVAYNANKISVRNAVEKIYNVKVTQVNMIKNEGKALNSGRISGKRSNFKKAIVTLRKGDSIELGESA